MRLKSDIHVFTATFSSGEDARAFAQPHWEPEPGEEASDDQYAAWEDRNPIWPMKIELGCRIDSDFVEIIWKSGNVPDWDYLTSQIGTAQVARIKDVTDAGNTLVLIAQEAIQGDKVELRSTRSLTYQGRYRSL